MTQDDIRSRAGCLAVAVLVLLQSAGWAEAPAVEPPYQISVVQSSAKAINYRGLKGSVDIEFKGTVLLPEAKGVAAVKNRAGAVEIKSEFEKLSAPSQFGPEYYTYVLWAISPDGRSANLGELIVDDGESSLKATVQLQSMSLLVTAEPYFAVSQPSNVVVLENAIGKDNKEKIEWVDAKYELLERGQYVKNIPDSDLATVTMDKKTPFAVYQARNAVRIAKAAGAESYDPEGFKNAERLLALSETKAGGKKGRAMTAREAVQSAEGSRLLSVKGRARLTADFERKEGAEQLRQANAEAASATERRIKAETAKGQSDAERAAALELAKDAAATTTESLVQAKAARAEAALSKGQAEEANARAQKMEGEKEGLRAQLLGQLNTVLSTRDTARGLIVSMTGVLFRPGSADLSPQAREKLAKVAGIVSSHAGLSLAVEGHTDSVGGEAFNQRLSESRAQAAREYLVDQGVSGSAVTSRGFGMAAPLESNSTPQGRQENRRVEMVVTGDVIGTR